MLISSECVVFSGPVIISSRSPLDGGVSHNVNDPLQTQIYAKSRSTDAAAAAGGKSPPSQGGGLGRGERIYAEALARKNKLEYQHQHPARPSLPTPTPVALVFFPADFPLHLSCHHPAGKCSRLVRSTVSAIAQGLVLLEIEQIFVDLSTSVIFQSIFLVSLFIFIKITDWFRPAQPYSINIHILTANITIVIFFMISLMELVFR